MYIPFQPHIELGAVIGARHGAAASPQTWLKDSGDALLFFSRGQWALDAVAEAAAGEGATPTLFIPEYFCEVSLAPLRAASRRLVFYRLNPDLTPDVEHLNALIRQVGTPHVLLQVHYWGIPHCGAAVSDFCIRHGIILVEDAAHSFVKIPGIGDNGWPVIYTPWKFVNLPDGALLTVPNGGKGRRLALAQPECSHAPAWRWLARGLVRRAIGAMGIPLHRIKPVQVKSADESEPAWEMAGPSGHCLSRRFLIAEGRLLEHYAEVRERIFRSLDATVADSSYAEFRIFKTLPRRFSPYLYPLKVPAEVAMTILRRLNDAGVSATWWSDLSPEVKGNPAFTLSNGYRKTVVNLPVHQGIGERALQYMSATLIDVLRATVSTSSLKPEMDDG